MGKAARKSPPRAWTVDRIDPTVARVRITTATRKGWEQWFLLRSDVHWDNTQCDRAMERRHLELAVERDAIILDCGDLFCAMQGKYDLRSDKSKVRPEHQKKEYLDALVSTAVDYYTPYAGQLAVIGRGNHEVSIRDRHETDLTDRLVAGLRQKAGAAVVAGGYTQWVVVEVIRQNNRKRRVIWWTHGYGGGGPVTQDMIQAQRQRTYIENADIMLSGHTHDSWCMDTVRLKINTAYTVERRTVTQLKLPTYKDEYANGSGGYHIQKGRPPKPLGAYWMRMFLTGHNGDLHTEITRAT